MTSSFPMAMVIPRSGADMVVRAAPTADTRPIRPREQNVTVEIARDYVELSNRHDVEAIGDLLAEDAVYRSDRVGEHRGRDAILEMMRGFFRRYPDVRWEVGEYRLDPDGAVHFDYRVTGESLAGGGTEAIRVAADGRIVEIEVRQEPPERRERDQS
jgi:hypothetical protein